MGATGAFVFCDAGLTGSPLGMALITTTGLSGVGLVVASTLPLVSTEVAGAPSKMWRANRSIRVWLIPTCSVHSRSISRACSTADGSFQRVTLNRPSASGTAANFTPKPSSVVTNPATSKSAIPPSTKSSPGWSFPTVRQAPKATHIAQQFPLFLRSVPFPPLLSARAFSGDLLSHLSLLPP